MPYLSLMRRLGLCVLFAVVAGCTDGDDGGEPVVDDAFELEVDSDLRVAHGGTALLWIRVVQGGTSAEPVRVTFAGTAGVSGEPTEVSPRSAENAMLINAPLTAGRGDVTATVHATRGAAKRSAPVRLIVHGPPGTLDPSFGFGEFAFLPQTVLIQPDNKTVLVGELNGDVAVQRYAANGAPDLFGDNGLMLFPIRSERDEAADVAVQPDGKLVVAGSSVLANSTDTMIARLTSEGALDPSFGIGGKVVIDLGGNDVARAVEVLADGKILVAAATTQDVVMLRLDAAGTPDPTYGDRGRIAFRIDEVGSLSDMRIQPNGRVVIAGVRRMIGGGRAIFILRILATGSPDPEFGSQGRVEFNPRGFVDETLSMSELALAPDGAILVCGSSSARGFVARRLPNGMPDPSFGGGSVSIHTTESVQSVDERDDGIFVVGFRDPDYGAYIASLRRTGGLNSLFGDGGFVRAELPGGSVRAAFSADGRVVIAGGTTTAQRIKRFWR